MVNLKVRKGLPKQQHKHVTEKARSRAVTQYGRLSKLQGLKISIEQFVLTTDRGPGENGAKRGRLCAKRRSPSLFQGAEVVGVWTGTL